MGLSVKESDALAYIININASRSMILVASAIII
jgi:hypothetical protein